MILTNPTTIFPGNARIISLIDLNRNCYSFFFDGTFWNLLYVGKGYENRVYRDVSNRKPVCAS